MEVTAVALAILEATMILFQFNNSIISGTNRRGTSDGSIGLPTANLSQGDIIPYDDNYDYNDPDEKDNDEGSQIKLFLEGLDSLLKQDPEAISHLLINHISEQHKILSNREIPARRIYEPFTVKIENSSLAGYFLISNGRVTTGEFTKPLVHVKKEKDTITISIEYSAEDIEVVYAKTFIRFLHKNLRGNVEIKIPSISNKIKFQIGNHSTSCVDIIVKELTATFTNPVVQVYGIYYEDYVFSSWIQSALSYLQNEINNQAIKYANEFLQKLKC
ncbi:hypothetical protein C0J52_12985 [Blattella germanica]|nr:hypothetical protein C0J52_12985 [Blattella germanica]